MSITLHSFSYILIDLKDLTKSTQIFHRNLRFPIVDYDGATAPQISFCGELYSSCGGIINRDPTCALN